MIPSNWPHWTLVFIGLVLILATIIVALALEPVAQAVSPGAEPKPTALPVLNYAQPLSANCQTCHFDQVALAQAGAGKDQLSRLFIESESLQTPHGRLGCITCHRGTGSTDSADAAHVALIADPSLHFAEECLLCHRDMPTEFPQDRLRTPHNSVVHSATMNVSCSDCHGGVGHGFDPVTGNVICSMSVCLDCHRARKLDSKLSDCSSCHIGPHDVAVALECNICHQSTETWNQVQLAVHPVELGTHTALGCFSCHIKPNFRGPTQACTSCHALGQVEPIHAAKGLTSIADQCTACHLKRKL